MGLLHWQRHDRTLRDVEVVALPGKGSLLAGPDVYHQPQRLLPARAGFLGRNPKATQFLDGAGAAGSDLDPALAQDVERSDPLSDAHRMVVGKGQQHHRVSDTNPR